MPLFGQAKREYQKNWVANRRAEWFKDKHCIDCGAKENLELDHVDPNEKVDHRIWSWSKQRIAEEVKKCVVRCEECHQIRSNEQNVKRNTKPVEELQHGSSHAYNVRGCRCDECKAYRHGRYLKRSSIAERSALNREVVGSIPAASASLSLSFNGQDSALRTH